MADDGKPDFSPATLGRLVAGMTTDDVESVVGCMRRPTRHEGRESFAWIAPGGMLRAFFHGPGRTLSAAILDVPEEQRHLDLGPVASRRLRQATLAQTWYCVPCRRRQRQPQSARRVKCESCGRECERPLSGVRVPAPRYAKAWDTFWARHRVEAELLEAYSRGEVREAIRLELLNITLPKRRRRET